MWHLGIECFVAALRGTQGFGIGVVYELWRARMGGDRCGWVDVHDGGREL